MKSSIIIFLISVTLSFAQENSSKAKKGLDDRYIIYNYVGKYIQQEYIDKNKEILPKIEKRIVLINRKIEVTNSKKNKAKYEDQKKELLREAEVIKMWPLYLEAFKIKHNSYTQGNSEKYAKAEKYIEKVKKKYTELTSNSFPNFLAEFYIKYPKIIEKIMKKETAKK